jgi:ribosome-associated toxin RatA of RatAB toxin-antitoxin module
MNIFWRKLNKYFNTRNINAKSQNPDININWTKSSKPFEEMDTTETKDFITRMAKGIFGNFPKKTY